jgi:group I intron endonuclease
MMYGIIYLTTNLINGKKYIGMCKSTHTKNYLGSGKLLKYAIKKYGRENFTREVLEECKDLESLSSAEEFWIKKYNAVNDDSYYNLTPGGCGGNSEYLQEYWAHFTKEERSKLRNWSKRNMFGENNPMYGKKHSRKTKELIGSKSVNRNWNRLGKPGKLNPNAKAVIVKKEDGVELQFDCLLDAAKSLLINYSTAKGLAQDRRFSKKYKVTILYV